MTNLTRIYAILEDGYGKKYRQHKIFNKADKIIHIAMQLSRKGMKIKKLGVIK